MTAKTAKTGRNIGDKDRKAYGPIEVEKQAEETTRARCKAVEMKLDFSLSRQSHSPAFAGSTAGIGQRQVHQHYSQLLNGGQAPQASAGAASAGGGGYLRPVLDG